jgi:hypothetical protein
LLAKALAIGRQRNRRKGVKRELARIYATSWRQRYLLVEAASFLVLAAAAIALLPFSRLARLAGKAPKVPCRTPDAGEIQELRWAIEVMARRVPFRSKCFERGLTALWMLRRRGYDATLFYGAARGGNGSLSAHVWVRAGGLDVIGCENAAEFATIACFPPEAPRC